MKTGQLHRSWGNRCAWGMNFLNLGAKAAMENRRAPSVLHDSGSGNVHTPFLQLPWALRLYILRMYRHSNDSLGDTRWHPCLLPWESCWRPWRWWHYRKRGPGSSGSRKKSFHTGSGAVRGKRPPRDTGLSYKDSELTWVLITKGLAVQKVRI